MAEAAKRYQEIGFPALRKGGQDKKLVDYFQSDTGMINQLVHLWKFDHDAAAAPHWVMGTASLKKFGGHDRSGVEIFDDLMTGSGASSRGRSN